MGEGRKSGETVRKKAGGRETTLLRGCEGNCFLWSDRYSGWHRAPEVTCYLAGSMWPGAEFNTKWSLRCCSLCQRSNKSDYYLSLQCVPIPLLDLYTLAC